MEDEQVVEQIQSKIAFLERAVAELSDVVFRQDREIKALESRLRALQERLNAIPSQDAAQPADPERPPHY
jgi:SlyX protein